jgi:hypothetical protein
MFLCNRDLKWARECGKLIVEPGAGTLQQRVRRDVHREDFKHLHEWTVEPDTFGVFDNRDRWPPIGRPTSRSARPAIPATASVRQVSQR